MQLNKFALNCAQTSAYSYPGLEVATLRLGGAALGALDHAGRGLGEQLGGEEQLPLLLAARLAVAGLGFEGVDEVRGRLGQGLGRANELGGVAHAVEQVVGGAERKWMFICLFFFVAFQVFKSYKILLNKNRKAIS